MAKISELYVDASFSDTREDSGYGAVLVRDGTKTEFSGVIHGARNSTDAEIIGVAEALVFLDTKEPLIILNDNTACVHVINGRKFNTGTKRMQKAVAKIREFKNIRGKWVRGHDESKENCRADELAKIELFSSEEKEYLKNEISLYIGIIAEEKRIGYSYVVEDSLGVKLFSGHRTIRNGGYGSYVYVISKVIGKPFNAMDDITHINFHTNEKNILSFLNRLMRMKKKNYDRMNSTHQEEGLYRALKDVRIKVFKGSTSEGNMRSVLTNAAYALDSNSSEKEGSL